MRLNAGKGLDILQGYRGKGVTQGVEAYAGENGPFQQNLQLTVDGARIGRLLWFQRLGEYPLSQHGLFPITKNLCCTGG